MLSFQVIENSEGLDDVFMGSRPNKLERPGFPVPDLVIARCFVLRINFQTKLLDSNFIRILMDTWLDDIRKPTLGQGAS